ncbi:hypothetical protein VTI74DRAFT_5107 [Chaetomium olivicolor]
MDAMTWSLVIAIWAVCTLGKTCPIPLALPITDVQVDPAIPDSIMRGIPARIGTPAQNIVMVPWPDLNNTYIYDDQSPCNSRVVWNEKICRIRRGGNYLETKSSSFSKLFDLVAAGGATQEIGTRGSESGVPKLISTSLAGTDVFAAGTITSSNGTMMPIGIPRQQWDNGYTTLHPLGLGSNSTYLNALAAAKMIPSRVWSIFWGRMWTGSATTDMDGSIVLGGYDKEKVIGRNFTQPLDYSEETGCWTGMKVTVSDFIVNFKNGTDVSLMPRNSAVTVCIVPQRQLLWEAPAGIIGNFEVATGMIERNMSFGLHRDARVVNMSNVQTIFDGDVTFLLSSGMQVRVPNNQFIVPAVDFDSNGSRTVNKSQKEILMSPVGSNPATLGRYFFTSAYLMVDHDAGTFTLWQANPSTKSTLTPVISKASDGGCKVETDDGDGAGASSSSSVNKGVIAGAAVGGAAVLAGLAALIVFLLRRKKKKQNMQANIPLQQSQETDEGFYYKVDNSGPKEVPGSLPHMAEMRADEWHRPGELHGESVDGPHGNASIPMPERLTYELDGNGMQQGQRGQY